MQNDSEPNDLAEVWQSAQHRRAVDIGRWLANYFQNRKRRKTIEHRPQYPSKVKPSLNERFLVRSAPNRKTNYQSRW
jgi:hypothetical protein